MKIKKNEVFIYSLVLLSMISFFGSGLYHLAKFETVDEHFWKYERITRYWKKGILERDIKKTYINDKPGVTTAIISGIGLIFEPNPEMHRVRDEKLTQNNDYTVYDSNRTESINLALRLPLLIFNSLSLLFFFWIIRKIADSEWLALFAVYLMAFSPILIGISQIINPDTLLWVFSSAAIFSYFALLKTDEKKFIILTAIFTGLTILSKYTGNILYPLYIIIFLSNLFIDFPKIEKAEGIQKYIYKHLSYFIFIALGSVVIFSLLLPAVFIKAKYLYRGTLGSPVLKSVYPLIIGFLGLLLADAILIKSRVMSFISHLLHKYKQLIFSAPLLFLFLIFIFIIVNPWTSNPIIPLENVKENSFVDKELLFPMLENYNLILKYITQVAIEIQPFLFSLPIISILVLLFLWGKIILKGLHKYQLYVFIISLFTLVYFIGTLASDVLANPRYSIMMYPLYAFLVAIGFTDIIKKLRIKNINIFNVNLGIICIIAITGAISLWNIKPFYFNYTNTLLPKEHVVTDAWGYGGYEAAQYLNSLPNPENIVIWADRSVICQFIKGKCIRDYKIDLNKTVPDYFVFSRRGMIRHPFIWEFPELASQSSFDYYSQQSVENYEWAIFIGDREDNFVKIIKSKE